MLAPRAVLVLAAVSLAGLALPGPAGCQQGGGSGSLEPEVRVTGRVVDEVSGSALRGAVLVFTGTEDGRSWQAVSDSSGSFALDGLSRGRYEVRGEALAFSSFTDTLTLDQRGTTDLLVRMVPDALPGEAVVVAVTRPEWLAREGFYERRSRALGYSLTRAEIEARNPYLVSDLFYGIPGADVIPERIGHRPAFVLLRGRCVPQVVLDGAPFSAPIPIDQVLAVQDLEAVEVYHGSTGPIRYSNSSCGTIMLWSRRHTPGEGRPLSWTRFLVAAGIVTWFTLSVW